MSSLVFALALFGCSDDATACERLSDKAARYESRVQCEMAIDAAFESDLARKADYPTVIAKCMDRGHWARLGDRPVDLSEPTIRFAAINQGNGG